MVLEQAHRLVRLDVVGQHEHADGRVCSGGSPARRRGPRRYGSAASGCRRSRRRAGSAPPCAGAPRPFPPSDDVEAGVREQRARPSRSSISSSAITTRMGALPGLSSRRRPALTIRRRRGADPVIERGEVELLPSRVVDLERRVAVASPRRRTTGRRRAPTASATTMYAAVSTRASYRVAGMPSIRIGTAPFLGKCVSAAASPSSARTAGKIPCASSRSSASRRWRSSPSAAASSSAPSASASRLRDRSRRNESESPARRCCAPSWRSRSSRLRSASPASTIRARERRSSSSRARPRLGDVRSRARAGPPQRPRRRAARRPGARRVCASTARVRPAWTRLRRLRAGRTARRADPRRRRAGRSRPERIGERELSVADDPGERVPQAARRRRLRRARPRGARPRSARGAPVRQLQPTAEATAASAAAWPSHSRRSTVPWPTKPRSSETANVAATSTR